MDIDPKRLAELLEDTGLSYKQAVRRGLATLGKPRKTAEEAIADGDYKSLDEIAEMGANTMKKLGKHIPPGTNSENIIEVGAITPFEWSRNKETTQVIKLDEAQISKIQELKQVALLAEKDRTGSRSIHAQIEGSGDFSISGLDCGDNLPPFADDDYEYSLTVPAEEKPRMAKMLKSEMARLRVNLDEVDSAILDDADVFLLLATQKLLHKNGQAVSILRELLEKHDVPCKFWCW